MEETLQNIIEQINQYKSDNFFLENLKIHVEKYIEENKYIDINNKFDKIFPNMNVTMQKYYSHEKFEDSRISNYYKIKFESSCIEIYFDKYYSKIDGYIYERFSVKNNSLTICDFYDINVCKLNSQIKNNSLQISPYTLSAENILKLLNFCLEII